MEKPFPALCKDCRYSEPEKDSSWTLRCVHPKVNAKDSWALAASSDRHRGTTCHDERNKRWPAACGMRGAQWEPVTPNATSHRGAACGVPAEWRK